MVNFLPIHDPLESARGLDLVPNDRDMVFMLRAREIIPFHPGALKTFYIDGLPQDSSRR